MEKEALTKDVLKCEGTQPWRLQNIHCKRDLFRSLSSKTSGCRGDRYP